MLQHVATYMMRLVVLQIGYVKLNIAYILSCAQILRHTASEPVCRQVKRSEPSCQTQCADMYNAHPLTSDMSNARTYTSPRLHFLQAPQTSDSPGESGSGSARKAGKARARERQARRGGKTGWRCVGGVLGAQAGGVLGAIALPLWHYLHRWHSSRCAL